MSADPHPESGGLAPGLNQEDWHRIGAALRYMGRDLHHRSYAVTAERRELLWQEMDACLHLAERIEGQTEPVVLRASPGSRACSLVTGASSGIGAALARGLASQAKHAAAPLVLVARRLDRLEAHAAQLRRDQGVEVHCLVSDLAEPGAAWRLLRQLQERELTVHTLVNNAGFGLGGPFERLPWERAEAMLQLMVTGCAALCHGVLPAMQTGGGGRIINVASLAGLVPGLPGSVLYSASKAFLIRFSQSLALENRQSGVRVIALCPGYVHTEFHAVLGVEERIRRNLPGLLWMEADDLARRTLAALDGRRTLVVPGLVNRLIAGLTHWLPERPAGRLTTAFSRRYRRR
ncbi:oxidoreductase, short-chain dehydrogenase/reductase family [Cyanobium sp. PCC 7001]|uniref:SDR family NAD(P)-dependent oxidoreductase n=1 Tax=Cyanobium sp. PCC 7001 TaxID=180281 RepID=UPI00018052A4|nr:SDR family oxidoreductase [Cyanobium sp. PCC 7001]EDY39545.1 oxidoreductase, short-chain dehydrogenase/reductase family [Cyanobium sp. PCC 7001]